MPLPRLTMRASLGLTVVVMGLLGMLLALVTGEVYRDIALDHRRQALSELVALKTLDLLRDLARSGRDFGARVQQDKAFQSAVATHDETAMLRVLDSHLHQNALTPGAVVPTRVQVLDAGMRVLAGGGGVMACPLMAGTTRSLAPGSSGGLPTLCSIEGRPYLQVLLPAGSPRVNDFLLVVIDPVQALLGIEPALGMPVMLSLPGGELLHRSPVWPEDRATDGAVLAAHHAVLAEDRAPLLDVAVMENVKVLHQELSRTRYIVMLAAGLATLFAAFVALMVLERTALAPLCALREQVRMIRADRKRLGESLTVKGNAEIAELSRDFNSLSAELKDLYEQLERMAYTDELTELPNRARFQALLEAGARPWDAEGSMFALFVMDLDRFKEVNDALGHHVGDELLRQVSVRLKSALRGSDILARLDPLPSPEGDLVARLGGDEFAAILPNVKGARDAAAVAQKLIQSLDQPFTVNGSNFTVGMSIGIALYPEHGEDPNTLLRQADAAMYSAKRGRRGYAVADNAYEHLPRMQFDMERDLRFAISDQRLELHYQPKIDLRNGRIAGVEALLRLWREGEIIAPDDFIPAAEQNGLINPITLWVLDKALADCASWRRRGYALDVAVNLSVVNLQDSRIVEEVALALARAGLAAGNLSLELTESAVMSDPKRALRVAEELDAMGVQLAIDDFGTGYSSLTYLKQLPVDEIKIDKSFVLDMKQDNNDAHIVRSTIGLAHTMGLRVVGEGVENENTLQLLKSLGCDLAQGYHISRPLPLERLLEWLAVAGRRDAALTR